MVSYYFNNEVGYNIAKTQSYLFSSYVYQALVAGQLRYLSPVNYSDINFWGNVYNGVSVPATHGIDPSKTKFIQTNE